MGRDVPLGRIAGIKVNMDLSVLLVAGYLTWVLATNRLPIEAPGQTDLTYWLGGLGGALLFFVSLMVHEMGHALVARDEGIGVRGISLLLLGGVTKLESAPTNAKAELRIALVGPVATAACSVAFFAGSYALPSGGIPGLIGNLFHLLGFLNAALALFNILPAAPLDGGTVLAATVWRRTGRQTLGMQVAGWAGAAAGSALVLLGFKALRDGGSSINGFTWLLVGGFVVMSAARSLRAVPLYAAFEGATVAEAMAPRPPTVPAWTTVGAFLRALPPDTSHQAYPVLGDDGRVTGLLTASAIRSVPPEQWDLLKVADLAFPLDRITVVRVDEPLLPAVQKVDGGDVRDGLVVGADGTIVGTIDAAALFRALERRKALEQAPIA
ncbi:site-2 protease family protein [Aquihabitans sp. G128]|uniref:site-2 protease family protein n=1 Tax=Aquihabitans sp. G128 TaxID=2849779 RepID=UPI001C23F97B|nr:site-2 protease family protein [Aquihabitans sp. G128]QXC63306.1 site-2 protease family protein [Aquihabitans sp. G128]